MHADRVDLTRLNYLKPAVTVILVVRQSRQRRADTGVDVRVIGE